MRVRLFCRFFLPFAMMLAAVSGFAQQDDEWYVGKPIRDVVFTGLENVSSSELDGLMNPFRGRLFDYSLFFEMQGILWALEYFDMIEPSAVPANPERSEVLVRFAVTERPVANRITFVGNSNAVRRGVLLDAISTKVNDVISQSRLRLDEQAIVNTYIERGFPDVQVRSEVQTVRGSTVLVFHITEGARVTIREIRFEGNQTFSDRTLRGQISLRASNFLSERAFNQAALVADRATLVAYYRDRGFIDAAVIDVTQEIVNDESGNKSLILTFHINEGEVYTFGGVTFEGNTVFSTAVLSDLIRSRIGDTVNSGRIQADVQRVADLYMSNGYIFNSITPEERRDSVNRTVSFNVAIVERGRAHIENISVVGNEKTRTDVILREIPLVPGDVFSRSKVEAAWRNLMNLRFFSTVIPETPIGSADGLMDLVFVVEEQPTMELQFGLTFSGSADPDTFPISAMVQWNDHNFRGSGNQLGVDVNLSTDTISSSVLYNQRWMFGLPLSGGFDFTAAWSKRKAAMNNTAPFWNGDEPNAFPDGFASREEYINASRQPSAEFLMDFQQVNLSLGFSTGYRWTFPIGLFSLGGGIRVGTIRTMYDSNVYRPFDPALREGNKEWVPMNSVWTSLALDRRDIAFDPTSGYYLFSRFSINGILPKEREYYIRNETNAQYFIPLFNIPVSDDWSFRMTLGLYSGLSFIFAQPGRDLKIEDANRLAIDGMFTARGWGGAFREKGHAMWNNWVELRTPLVPNLLAWDFFFDAAGVAGTSEGQQQFTYFDNFDITNMRFSFGGGLRFTIPQLPFRLSLAKRFRVIDGQVQWQKGALFATDDPNSGLDPVLSISVSF